MEQSLNDAQLQLETQGKKALENALQRSKQAGQQSENMTRIAQEARELADILDDQASHLVSQAKAARNQSDEVYQLAKDANTEQVNPNSALFPYCNSSTFSERDKGDHQPNKKRPHQGRG